MFLRPALALVLLTLVPACHLKSTDESEAHKGASNGRDECLGLAEEFKRQHGQHPSPTPNASLMLYFLHIPRTAGRTYHSCFLKQAHPPSKRCAKSYDVLRLDESMGGCGLLSSHDDYSVIDMLPPDAAIVTQLREPVDRVLSSYEFATEVAARAAKQVRPKVDPSRTNTRNVWPWSLLVPLLEQEIWRKFPAEQVREQAEGDAEEGVKATEERDPYNNMVTLSLMDYLELEEVQHAVNNGATLQVLGLTSYSKWESASKLRGCLPDSPAAQDLLLELALERLDRLLHVGVFDRLEDSILSLAATLNISMEGPSWTGKTPDTHKPKNDDRAWMTQRLLDLQVAHERISNNLATMQALRSRPEGSDADPDVDLRRESAQGRFLKQKADNEVEAAVIRSALQPALGFDWRPEWDSAYQSWPPLWRSYHHCVDAARKRNAKRRASSFKQLEVPGKGSLSFDRKTRESLAARHPAVLEKIRDKNKMDTALYEKGRQLLEARLEQHRAAGRLEGLGSKEEADLAEFARREGTSHNREEVGRHSGSAKQHHMRARQDGAPKSGEQPHEEL